MHLQHAAAIRFGAVIATLFALASAVSPEAVRAADTMNAGAAGRTSAGANHASHFLELGIGKSSIVELPEIGRAHV